VCSDCSKDKAVVLKISATDKGKHRNCDICKKDANNQKRIRDDFKLRFNTDSVIGKGWINMLTSRPNDPPNEYNQFLGSKLVEIADFGVLYEQQRSGLNYSWFDMIYWLTEKTDKKLQ